jgi:plasmid stabilization system protein ParE
MVEYKVAIDEQAGESLRQIYNYLKENASEQTAKKVRDGILDAIDGLAKMPHRHAKVLRISTEHKVYRRILKWSYKIIYRIFEDELEVIVVEIVHAKQDPSKLENIVK